MIQINVRFFDFYVFRGNGANRSDAINFFNEEKIGNNLQMKIS